VDLEARVNQYYDELNENDKEVISYIVTNKRLVTDMTITTLAEASLTSKSSILRLTKKLGYSGYSEFKYSLQNQLRENKQLNEVLKFLKCKWMILKIQLNSLSRST
jgi:Transcriptional regulators